MSMETFRSKFRLYAMTFYAASGVALVALGFLSAPAAVVVLGGWPEHQVLLKVAFLGYTVHLSAIAARVLYRQYSDGEVDLERAVQYLADLLGQDLEQNIRADGGQTLNSQVLLVSLVFLGLLSAFISTEVLIGVASAALLMEMGISAGLAFWAALYLPVIDAGVNIYFGKSIGFAVVFILLAGLHAIGLVHELNAADIFPTLDGYRRANI